MEDHIKALFRHRESVWVEVGEEGSAADAVARAFRRAEEYSLAYPSLSQGDMDAVGRGVATVRLFCLTPEGEAYLLKSFCEDPMVAVDYFARKTGARFVVTARVKASWPNAARDDVEMGQGEAAVSFPLFDLVHAYGRMDSVVDKAVEDAVTIAWGSCPDGAAYIRACRDHFGWGKDDGCEGMFHTWN